MTLDELNLIRECLIRLKRYETNISPYGNPWTDKSLWIVERDIALKLLDFNDNTESKGVK